MAIVVYVNPIGLCIQYSKYQKFATEECILQMGGLLCPNRGCGEGLLPDEGGRRIQCPPPNGCGVGDIGLCAYVIKLFNCF